MQTNTRDLKTTGDLQDALTEAEGLLGMALSCLHETGDNKVILGGIETALTHALKNVTATGNALDAVNVHRIAEFSHAVKGIAA